MIYDTMLYNTILEYIYIYMIYDTIDYSFLYIL